MAAGQNIQRAANITTIASLLPMHVPVFVLATTVCVSYEASLSLLRIRLVVRSKMARAINPTIRYTIIAIMNVI